MPNKNPRISMVIEHDIFDIIHALAKKNGVSNSAITRELVLEAIESREDTALIQIIKERLNETKESEFLSHEEVWD